MHNFSVRQLKILTLALPENTGIDMKEAPLGFTAYSLTGSPVFDCQSSRHPLNVSKHTSLPFVSVQIHLKSTTERLLSELV